MQYLLGLDIGTTNIKAIAIRTDGTQAAYHALPTPIVHPQPEWSEFVPEAIWKTTCACIQKVCTEINPEEILSVGVSAMAETGIPMDAEGRPLYNFIAWYDFRADAQTQTLINRLGRKRIYEITGQTVSPKYGLPKIMWLRDMEPQKFENARFWLSMEDYIIYRLSGRRVTDYSIASRTLAFDINKLNWSQEILQAANLEAELFPETVPGGTAVGRVHVEASRQTGLPESVCVATGGHDHACAAVTIGISEPDVVLDSMGTAEVSMAAVELPKLTDEALERYFSFYPHFGKRLYRVITSNQCCGASVEWFMESMGQDLLALAREKQRSKYDVLYERVDTSRVNRGGLFFLPFLRGTVEQGNASGVFWGMRDIHGQGDLIAALLEGMCFELKRQVNGYRKMFDGAYDKLRVVGGLSRSAVLMQMKANVHGAGIVVPENREAAGTGAALLGGIGAGRFTPETLPLRIESGNAYINDPELSKQYEAVFKQYNAVRKNALAAFRTLAAEE